MANTNFHVVFTSGVETGDVLRKEGKWGLLRPIDTVFHPMQETQTSILQKTKLYVIKFTSHKTHHLNPFKVYHSHLKCTIC